MRRLVELEERHWWYRERRILLAGMLRKAFPDGARGLTALDVGAAGGGNTRVLQSAGMCPVAVEYGPDGAEISAGRGLTSVRGDARKLPFRSASADLLVAFDVIEHVDDDAAALRDFRRVLKPGGALIVAVPADMQLWSAHDEAVGHFRRYERDALANAISAAGFELRNLWSWNVLLRPLVALSRRRSTGSDLQPVHPVVNAALGAVVALERRMPRLERRRGVTLFVEARRPPA